METFQNQEKINQEIEILRQEIFELKEKEMAKKEKDEFGYNSHFDEIDPAVLNEKDLTIYKKFKEETLTLEELKNYQRSFNNILRQNLDDPRGNFMAWLVNQTSNLKWIKLWNPSEYEKYKHLFEDEEKV